MKDDGFYRRLDKAVRDAEIDRLSGKDKSPAKCNQNSCSLCGATLPPTLRGMKPRDICEQCQFERESEGDGMSLER